MTPTSTKPTTLLALRHGGTHLIQPIVRFLTDKPVHVPKGDNAITCIPSPKLVIFLRDPRNRAVSHLRYKNPKLAPADADARFARLLGGRKERETPVEFMLRWATRWASHPTGHTVRFEDMVSNGLAETERLRAYLEAVPSAAAAFEYTFGKSGTWTGRHSRWQEWFGPESSRVWAQQGGDRLVELMGYSE